MEFVGDILKSPHKISEAGGKAKYMDTTQVKFEKPQIHFYLSLDRAEIKKLCIPRRADKERWV